MQSLQVVEKLPHDYELPPEIRLPIKDRPIMIAAIKAEATHLITGDLRDFGELYGRTVAGVIILPPAAYLKGKA